MNKSLSLVAALLAVIAIAISTTGKSGSTSGPEMDQSKSRNPGQQFEKLEDQLRQATETIETLSRKIEKLETRPAQSSATATDNSELQQRIAALEAQQQAMTKFTNDFDQYGVVSSMEAELVNAYTTLMDTNQTIGARLKQVGQLKRYGYFDDKALQVVSDIYLQTDDFNEKGQALISMKGLVTPEFRDQVLTDLAAEVEAGNKSGRFRYYAIEALEPMMPDPAVREWLVHLSENDPQPKLAGRAGQALSDSPAK
ncbi:MAG: hypothetical protein ACKVHO_13580 [Verrucomicrobiia bacterium]|jgi:FtsZ-binding cell division protein ZapB